MNDLRTAAQQALEALEAFLSDELRPHEAAKISAALRAALTQQDEPAQKQVTYSTGGLHLEAGFYSEVDLREMLKALDSMNAAARRAMEETK